MLFNWVKTDQGGIIPLEKNINGIYSVAPLQEKLFDTVQQTRIIKEEEKNEDFIKKNNLKSNPQKWIDHFHECYNLTMIINDKEKSTIIFNIPYQDKIYPIEYKYRCLFEYDNFDKQALRIYSGPSANVAIIITELQKATQREMNKLVRYSMSLIEPEKLEDWLKVIPQYFIDSTTSEINIDMFKEVLALMDINDEKITQEIISNTEHDINSMKVLVQNFASSTRNSFTNQADQPKIK